MGPGQGRESGFGTLRKEVEGPVETEIVDITEGRGRLSSPDVTLEYPFPLL